MINLQSVSYESYPDMIILPKWASNSLGRCINEIHHGHLYPSNWYLWATPKVPHTSLAVVHVRTIQYTIVYNTTYYRALTGFKWWLLCLTGLSYTPKQCMWTLKCSTTWLADNNVIQEPYNNPYIYPWSVVWHTLKSAGHLYTHVW